MHNKALKHTSELPLNQNVAWTSLQSELVSNLVSFSSCSSSEQFHKLNELLCKTKRKGVTLTLGSVGWLTWSHLPGNSSYVMLSYPAATTRACWASRPQHWLFSQTSPLTSKLALTWPDCHHTDPLVCLPGCKIDTTASPMWVNAGRRWHRRPFSHLTVFQRSCCLILVKWYKWLVHFVNPPASRCGLKLSYLAYFHLATVEECDSTAAEVLVAFFFLFFLPGGQRYITLLENGIVTQEDQKIFQVCKYFIWPSPLLLKLGSVHPNCTKNIFS